MRQVAGVMLALDPLAAQEPLLRRVAALADAGAESDIQYVLHLMINEKPADQVPPYARLRRAFPAQLTPAQAGWLLTAIRVRKDIEGVDFAVSMLRSPQSRNSAFTALAALDSPDAWRKALAALREEAASGKADAALDLYVRTAESRLADPARHAAEKRAQERSAELAQRRGAVRPAAHELHPLRERDFDAYVAQSLQRLERLDAVAQEFGDARDVDSLRNEIAIDYVRLGHGLRFRAKQPRPRAGDVRRVGSLAPGPRRSLDRGHAAVRPRRRPRRRQAISDSPRPARRA